MLQFIQTAKANAPYDPTKPLEINWDGLTKDMSPEKKSALLAKIESSPGVVSASDLGIKSIELKEGEFPKIEFEGTYAPPETMLVGVGLASGSDMSSIAVCKPIPSGGQPGQVLGVSKNGDPEWVELSFDKPLPPPPSGLKQALKVLEEYGFKFHQVSVQNDYAGYDTLGSYSPKSHILAGQSIEVQMMVYPPSSKYNEVMTVLHDAAMNKGFKY